LNKNFLHLSNQFKDLLKNKIVVVTGAGSGFGEAIALGFTFAGARIGVLDVNAEAVKMVVEKINSEFPNCAFPMVASVTDEIQLEKAYNELAKAKGFGSVDILINCAGVARLGPISSLSAKDVKFANDININGYFLNAMIASKFMVEKKNGCILNVSSSSARTASENSSLYGVAKEAQCMMTRLWAMDLGKYGIRVNSILPGDLYGDPELGITSGIWNQTYFEKKAVDKRLVKPNDPRLGGKSLNKEIRALVIDHYAKRTSLAQPVHYSDVLGLIILLCSDLSSKITGESIALTAGNPGAFSK
jgi:NAD(P)-dependent dehydrogenase (short-subunit alcohol dehydrogenase family)